jgi:hypothetical protein
MRRSWKDIPIPNVVIRIEDEVEALFLALLYNTLRDPDERRWTEFFLSAASPKAPYLTM